MGAFNYATQFMIFLFVWLVAAMVSYSFAMLVGGMGSLKQHLYMLSLPMPLAPLIILLLTGVLGVLYSIQISALILGVILITVYIVNILIAAMKEVHRFGFMHAAVSTTIPFVIVGSVVVLLMFVFRK